MISRRRGFSLIEMAFAITLFSIFCLLFSQLFVANVRVTSGTHKNQAALARWEHVLHQLRRDVWNARSIMATGPYHLTLGLADGKEVVWSWADEQRTQWVRAEVGEEKRWPDFVFQPEFEVNGATVLIRLPNDTPYADRELRLVSQLILNDGSQR